MKKHLIAAAALATLSTAALAQNVTVYGIVDMAVNSLNKTNANGLRNTTLDSGGMSPSIFGFRGTEDLGGGMKASFNLEGHIAADTGAGQQWGGLFGRQANVGLSTSAGSITLGKQYTAAVLAYAATDPRGLKETNSGLMSWAFSQKPLTVDNTANGSQNTNVPIDVFMANAVGVSTQVGKLSLSAQYGAGEAAGNTSQNAAYSVGAVYADGPLTLSAGYQKQNGNNANTSINENAKTTVGAAYKFGAATVKVNYLDTSSNNTSGVEAFNYRVTGLGVDYPLNAKNTLTVAYYNAENKAASASATDDSKTWIVSNDYSLSKRTTLYGLVSGSKQGAGYTGASASGTAAAGVTQTLFQAGVRHTF
jgi:predicted porin